MFHPIVQEWFESRFAEPSEPQQQGWPAIQRGENVLIAAPTGSGKTLAAFLSSIDTLVRQGLENRALPEAVQVLYISPLKALANDIRLNLLDPLEGIEKLATHRGFELPAIRSLVRTGDTASHQRRKALQQPPHILVTTPESLFILLTSAGGRDILREVKTVIVDEIHALARDKRGSHLVLSLERLEALVGRPLQRIGLSATQKPIEQIALFLTGAGRPATILNSGHSRKLDLKVEVPRSELGAVATHEVWEEIYERLAELARLHQTTLVFVNTRRLSERVAHNLSQRLGEEAVAAHHGSLSRDSRLDAENRLKEGNLKLVVATASLELGIDVGAIDLVCQIGSTRSISLALQRVGRSGHWKGAVPRGRLFATSRDELLECAALLRAIQAGRLDRIRIPKAPLDVLAQQIVAACAGEEWDESSLFDLFRRADPYSKLDRSAFDAVVSVLSEGISTKKGRRGAYLHRDRVNEKIRGRRGARLAAITSGGAIPENANYLVRAEPEDILVGTLDEDFAVESMRGDIFLLGNTSWRIQRVEPGVVRVEDARGAPPNVPFWRGEAPGRTDELSEEVSILRTEIAEREAEAAASWLIAEAGLPPAGAAQAAAYVHAGRYALGRLPSQQCIVAERFFDEGGGMQLVLHAPFGSRINKAWGLALRKRFCRSFNFELQAAATEDGIVISLSDQHSFPLETVFSFLSSHNVREVLIQALLAVPLFGARWRWTATRALAVLRFSGGRKVPPPLQRLRADDLLATVFPEQAACLEHIHGDIEIPDHPLVQELLTDCLHDAMDIDGLEKLLSRIESGEIECVAVDTREPSPFSHEILNANPYAFLDEAPLEERRTRAVQTRRSLDNTEISPLAILDADAIERVQQESWPTLRNADELHDALLTLVVLPENELVKERTMLEELVKEARVFAIEVPLQDASPRFWAPAERAFLAQKAYPEAIFSPPLSPQVESFQWDRDLDTDNEQAVTEIVRSRLASTGPQSTGELSQILALPEPSVTSALHRLEGQGQILRGSFRPGREALEWCDRRLLAQIHRLTVGRLRKEIEPASTADFMRFLFRWQHLAPGTSLFGETGTALVLEQLQGFEAPGAGWESALLPMRITDYEKGFLDRLCLSGHFGWGRLSSWTGRPGAQTDEEEDDAPAPRRVQPTRLVPVAFFEREQFPVFFSSTLEHAGRDGEPIVRPDEALHLSDVARSVLEQLQKWGASFFPDLVRTSGKLPSQVESGLWELVAAGLVTADGFDNLRALINPLYRRSGNRHPLRKKRRQLALSAGRWSLIAVPQSVESADSPNRSSRRKAAANLEVLAWQFLARWGVVFRDILLRESFSPPWRELLMIYRRLEAQGQIRGGRFVTGFAGEQFALPEAVEALRAVRRSKSEERIIRISAADPLNLSGILLPGPRTRPHPETFLYFRNGVPIEEPQQKALGASLPGGAAFPVRDLSVARRR